MQKYRSSTVRTMGRVGKLGETRVARFRSWRKRKGRRRANSNFELAKPVSPSSAWLAILDSVSRSFSNVCASLSRVECERERMRVARLGGI